MNWPIVKLREVLRLDLDKTPIDISKTYEMVGVYSFGRGLFIKEPVLGSNTSYKYFYQLKADHIVMSQLFGWEGALALSSKNFAGLYVSPQFPTFCCNEAQLDRSFLGYIIRRPAFWKDLGSRATGMGDRRRTLNPDALFECEIPLPPLDEQRRIVAHIEALAARIAEARDLRQQAVEETSEILSSYHLALSGERKIRVGDLLQLDERSERVELGKAYPQVGVRGFGQGLFAKDALDATETSYRAFNRLYTAATVLSQVKGWEGAIGVCPPELNGWYVSPEYRTFSCIEAEAVPEYLALIIPTPWFWMKLKHLSRGLGGRRERVRPELFLDMEIEMPVIERQHHAVKAFQQLHVIKRLQTETAAELDVLLPAVLDRAFRGGLV